jgi:plasmid stabilization system protein ParE
VPTKVEIHPEALAEAEAAAAWYAERDRAAARAFVRELQWAKQRVAEATERWPLHIEGTRRLLLRRFPYAVVYRFSGGVALIVAVAHHRRRPGYWRERR